MYRIKPIQIKEEQERVCVLCKVEYDADALAYEAVEEDGTLLGVCQFHIKDDAGYIDVIKNAPGTDDGEAMYIMGKATLNFIDLCGIKKAYYLGEDTPLVRSVGFSPDKDGKLFVDLEGFFEHKCHGEAHDRK